MGIKLKQISGALKPIVGIGKGVVKLVSGITHIFSGHQSKAIPLGLKLTESIANDVGHIVFFQPKQAQELRFQQKMFTKDFQALEMHIMASNTSSYQTKIHEGEELGKLYISKLYPQAQRQVLPPLPDPKYAKVYMQADRKLDPENQVWVLAKDPYGGADTYQTKLDTGQTFNGIKEHKFQAGYWAIEALNPANNYVIYIQNYSKQKYEIMAGKYLGRWVWVKLQPLNTS